MMMARFRQKASWTSGGRSRTLTRGSSSSACPSSACPSPRISPRTRPNGVGLPSSAAPLGTGGGVIVWFHVAPTAPVLGDLGCGDSGAVAGAGPAGGRRCGRGLAGRPTSMAGTSSVASVVATPPKIPSPSLAGLPAPGRPGGVISGAPPSFPAAGAAGAAGGSTTPVSGSGSSGRPGRPGGAAAAVDAAAGSADGGLAGPRVRVTDRAGQAAGPWPARPRAGGAGILDHAVPGAAHPRVLPAVGGRLKVQGPALL